MIKIEEIKDIAKGKYLSLKEVFFNYKGKKKRWEVCSSMNSVSILIYNKDLNSLILVKQFRLPVYLKNNDGYTLELCAGLCDKDKDKVEIAKEEVLEECGYEVESSSLKEITSTWASVGTNAARQTIFYVEVDESQRVNSGGGIDDEDIEVVFIKAKEVEKVIFDENIVLTPGAKFALFWWLHYKKEKNETYF